MNKERKSSLKLSKISLLICIAAFFFSGVSILITYGMNQNAQKMYEHPYAVSNSARAMRSRLWDMKRFSGILMTHAFQSKDDKDSFFQSRYDMQNEEIENIRRLYLGPVKDVDDLQEAMDKLIEVQTKAVGYAYNHAEDEVREYMDANVYPYYDSVSGCLKTIIDFADAKIYSLNVQVKKAGIVSTCISLIIAFSTIGLTILSSRQERRNIEAMAAREHDLRDALYLAQQSSNAKKDFLSRMSHEIRTPMNVIVGMTTIAGTNESIVPAIYSQAAAKGSVFECNFKNMVSETVIGDSLRMNQILLNLLSNAIKFTPAGGIIRLVVSQAPVKNGHTKLTFLVEDSGIGMSEEFLEHLFTPFEQEDGTVSRKYGGTGLGMAITKNLVGLLGGEIRVKSKQGEGTAFTVELPLEVPEEADKPEIGGWDNLKVLVVDDDEVACTHASMLLKRMGIDADWVQQGSIAVRMVVKAHEDACDYDVCLVDWKMPEMDGVETTRRIRGSLGADIPIILLSAYNWEEVEQEALEAGINGFLTKPIFRSELVQKLRFYIMGPSVRTQEASCHMPCNQFDGLRILVAEDNELNREIAVELLGAAGIRADTVENGLQAVRKMEQEEAGHYDLVLMDIRMPVMDGLEATGNIRKLPDMRKAGVPIIAMTADAFEEDIQKCRNAGMDGYISKPIDINKMFEIIRLYYKKENEEQRT